MLFSSTKHPKPIRIQSPWIDESILAAWLKYMTNTFGEPDFIEIEAVSYTHLDVYKRQLTSSTCSDSAFFCGM